MTTDAGTIHEYMNGNKRQSSYAYIFIYTINVIN